MRRLTLPSVLIGLLPLTLAGCHQGYSPNTYASGAAQEEAAVQRGVIIGVRQVMISANDTLAVAAGGAAGGVAGSQAAGTPVTTVLGAIGGTLAGGIGGAAAAHGVGDTKGWEYIVQEDGNKLVSVTQTSKTPLSVGLHVLVISDAQQARIVPDYTVQLATAPAPTPPKPPAAPITEPPEINVGPFLPPDTATPPLQIAPASPSVPAPAVPAPTPTAAPAATPNPTAATPAPTPAPASTTPPTETTTAPTAS